MPYDNIKNAALKLFSEKGFDGTTIKEIASASGLKPSSVYSHITNKDELFIGIWNQCVVNTFSSVADIEIKIKNKVLTDPGIILYTYYITIINHFIDNPSDYLFLKQATFFIKDKSMLDKIKIKNPLDTDIAFQYFGKYFTELQRLNIIAETDTNDLCSSYIGIIIAYLEQYLMYSINLSHHYIDALWHVFWKGISK
ncbi:MAG: tetR [Clostridia bacterium]|jgi:AcrR family transcriptional regulator|nr:tetR [Clostridia bacterium]